MPGSHVVADPASWLFGREEKGGAGDGGKSPPPRLAAFSLVLACGLPSRVLQRLDAACSARSTGLVAIGGAGGSLAGYVWTGGFASSGVGGGGGGCMGGGGGKETGPSHSPNSSRLGEHRVVESRPDDSPRDLRLGCSPRVWPRGLLESAREALAKMEAMSDAEHSHVPAAVLVAAAVVAWGQQGKNSSSSSLPRPTAADRAEIAAVLSSLRRRAPSSNAGAEGEALPHLDEENFDEAERLLRLALSPGAPAAAVPSRVADVLADPLASCPPSPPMPEPSPSSSSSFSVVSMSSATPSGFWCLVAGLREFAARKGREDASVGSDAPSPSSSSPPSNHLLLPLDGELPDMTSSSEAYVALQRLYRAAADAEAREVSELASAAAARAATAALAAAEARRAQENEEADNEAAKATPHFPPSAFAFDPAEVKTFCKNARHLRVVRVPSFRAALGGPSRRLVAAAAKRALGEGDPGAPPARAAAALLVLLAADRMIAFPPSSSSSEENDNENDDADADDDDESGAGVGSGSAEAAEAMAAASEGDEASLCAVAAALKAGAAALLAEAESGGGGGGEWGGGGGGSAKGRGAKRAQSPGTAAAAAAAALSGGAGQALDDAAAEGARAGVLEAAARAGAGAGAGGAGAGSGGGGGEGSGGRAGAFTGPKLHAVAAVLGGLAAQEAIKLATRQFVPAPGIIVYDGATQAVTVLPLGGG